MKSPKIDAIRSGAIVYDMIPLRARFTNEIKLHLDFPSCLSLC